MKNILKSFAYVLILCLALPALAGSIKEYSADMVDVKTGRLAQKLYVTPDKIYSESYGEDGKMEGRSLIRFDQGKMYLFMEENKTSWNFYTICQFSYLFCINFLWIKRN